MNIVKDHTGKEYQVVNDTCYHVNTPPEVIRILESCRLARRSYRLRIWYGDIETGETWIDPQYNVLDSDIRSGGAVGYIGRSTGKIKIPLEIWNERSHGGGAILDNCIVRIEYAWGKGVIYEHPNFHYNKQAAFACYGLGSC